MTSSWWANKLGNQGNPPPAPAQQRPPQPQVRPGYIPPTPPPPAAAPRPQDIQVTEDNAYEVAGMWQGGEGVKDAQRCPRCNSDLYFSNSKSKVYGQHGMASASPRCYACGYPREQGLPPV